MRYPVQWMVHTILVAYFSAVSHRGKTIPRFTTFHHQVSGEIDDHRLYFMNFVSNDLEMLKLGGYIFSSSPKFAHSHLWNGPSLGPNDISPGWCLHSDDAKHPQQVGSPELDMEIDWSADGAQTKSYLFRLEDWNITDVYEWCIPSIDK